MLQPIRRRRQPSGGAPLAEAEGKQAARHGAGHGGGFWLGGCGPLRSGSGVPGRGAAPSPDPAHAPSAAAALRDHPAGYAGLGGEAQRSAARGGGGVYEWRGPRGMNGGGRARARAGEAGGGVYEWGVRVGVGMGPDAARPCNAEHRQGRREAKRRGSAGLPPPIPTARDVTAVSIEIR